MNKGVYQFYVDYGRGYDLEGTFSATADEVVELTGKLVRFGEVCGKHSDMTVTLEEEHITLLCDDPAVVAAFDKFGFASGLNPLAYYRERCKADEAEL